ncbi:MAG: hypothetical protein FH749_01205 [Firmicutes bacterium]|nr:hypothetical protein [Bacillota bacterium]
MKLRRLVSVVLGLLILLGAAYGLGFLPLPVANLNDCEAQVAAAVFDWLLEETRDWGPRYLEVAGANPNLATLQALSIDEPWRLRSRSWVTMRGVYDRRTFKRGVLLSIQSVKVDDDKATVYANKYQSGLGGEYYRVILWLDGNMWRIKQVELLAIS